MLFRKLSSISLVIAVLLCSFTTANALVEQKAIPTVSLSAQDEEYAKKRVVVVPFAIEGHSYTKGTILDITNVSDDGKWIYFKHDSIETKISNKKVVSGKVTKLNTKLITIEADSGQIVLADVVWPVGYVLDSRMSCESLDPAIVNVDGFADAWVLCGTKRGTTYLLITPFYSDKTFKVKIRVK